MTWSVRTLDIRCPPPLQLVAVMKQRRTFPTNVADGVKGISDGLPHDSYEHVGNTPKLSSPPPSPPSSLECDDV